MKNRTGKERQTATAKRLCGMLSGLLLMQIASSTATADQIVPGSWVQRASAQQANARHTVDTFSGIEVIAMDELEGMRGGLSIAGMEVDIGAIVRTIIDGQLALESQISLTSANEIAAAIDAPGSGINAAASTTSGGSNGVKAGTDANSPVPTANNVTLQPTSNGAANPAANNSASFVINDSKGLTQVIHDLTRNRVVSAIVNQANGRDIRQEVDINITVSNFREIQRAAALQQVSRSLDGFGR